MGWSPFSWLFGKKEEKPPEQLVLGAELACPYGTEHSYLFVQSGDIDINGLPEACVTDRVKSVNIMPFGHCTYIWAACSMIMELEEQWENEEPQKMLSNGKEIITTKSTLLCRACGGAIKAVTSGQDGVEAERIAREIEMVREMEEKYPGLLDILGNPYGSLYLEEGMYQTALRFLEERVEKNGGEVWILGLYSERGLENTLVRSCLEQLLTVSGTEREKSVIEKLNVMGLKNGMEPGWDVYTLNKEMIGMLEQRCEGTAKKIKTNDNYRWAEENKQQLDWYTERFTDLAYLGLIYYWSMNIGQGETYKKEAEAENAKKLEETEEKVGESETEATVESEGGTPTLSGQWKTVNESMSDFSRAYQKQITGQEGMVWVQNGVKFDGMKDGVLLDAKGKYAQFINPNTGEFYGWFTGKQDLLDEAARQIKASEGANIQWYFAEEEALDAVQNLFMNNGINEIELVYKAHQ